MILQIPRSFSPSLFNTVFRKFSIELIQSLKKEKKKFKLNFTWSNIIPDFQNPERVTRNFSILISYFFDFFPFFSLEFVP